MEETKDLIQQRRDKLDEIRQFGVEPYPHKYDPTHTTSAIHRDFADTQETPDETHTVRIAGRIMTKRDHGKSQLRTSTGWGRQNSDLRQARQSRRGTL